MNWLNMIYKTLRGFSSGTKETILLENCYSQNIIFPWNLVQAVVDLSELERVARQCPVHLFSPKSVKLHLHLERLPLD